MQRCLKTENYKNKSKKLPKPKSKTQTKLPNSIIGNKKNLNKLKIANIKIIMNVTSGKVIGKL